MYRLKCIQLTLTQPGNTPLEIISKPFSIEHGLDAPATVTVEGLEDANKSRIPGSPFRAASDFRWTLRNDDSAHDPAEGVGAAVIEMDSQITLLLGGPGAFEEPGLVDVRVLEAYVPLPSEILQKMFSHTKVMVPLLCNAIWSSCVVGRAVLEGALTEPEVRNFNWSTSFINNGNSVCDASASNINQVNPCAFLYEGADTPLVVTFKYAFKKSDPPKKETYRLKGTQAGSGGFEIISAPFSVKNPTGATISAVATTLEDFHHAEKVPGSPFRAKGICNWTLLHNDDKHTPVECAGTATTSLDFFFMFGPHKVLYDDDHEYHLELTRLVYPSYSFVAGKKWSEVEADIIKEQASELSSFARITRLVYLRLFIPITILDTHVCKRRVIKVRVPRRASPVNEEYTCTMSFFILLPSYGFLYL
ncbi:hypothetical protein B0T24DRAFT_599471 [Lasiosphaeria ovina]|uniref:Uncharacterized protein n=1 Tax=Lasiosphaeria ovina TaxID=92902 RepID=A0AAE0MZ93_9PEZI|nr:hypothetical protein B0T24DRAFT_599471 [Lasiosphaeria ovina]